MIYFGSVRFSREVHTPGLGFTRYVFPFVEASNEAAAKALIHAHYTRLLIAAGDNATSIVRVSVTPACQQNENRYAFPESIIRQTEIDS